MLAKKSSVDVSQVFLTFMALVGDCEKTAAALDLDPKFVAALAKDESWDVKIQRVSMLSKGEKPGDWERAVNRALCYVQAHTTGQLLDKVLAALNAHKNGDDLLDALATKTKFGDTYSVRLFADLTAAMEKVHSLKYQALGDSVKERADRADQDGGDINANSLHAAVIAALNGVAKTPDAASKLVIDAQEIEVRRLADKPPESPA